MRNNLVLGTVALSAAVLIAGCFGHAGAYAEVDAPVVFVAEPTLVVVEPNVWVVRDYDYAVYYVDDFYWVYRDDVWHRSRAYDSGWATVEVSVVPRLIVSRDHRAYVHYHGSASAQTRSAPREGREVADAHRDVPPGRDKDKDQDRDKDKDKDKDKDDRRPEQPDDRHDAPPGRDKDDARRSPEHAGDRDASPKPEEREKGDDKRGNDKGKPGKDDDKRDHQKGHDKK